MSQSYRCSISFVELAALLLSAFMTTGPATTLFAQTNAAAQAVRERVQGLSSSRSTGGVSQAPAQREAPPTAEQSSTPATGSVDVSYVPQDAVAVVVLRPAKLLASPLGKLLPVEVISAYGVKFTGLDPAKVDEIIAFGNMPEGAPGYGVVAKFNEPFKGSAIPASLRADAKPGELGGRRYLQSSDPAGKSFYGPDNKTLIVAPDATLRSIVENKDQAKSSPLLDRVLAAPADSDAYLAVDVVSLRPMMGMVQMYAQQLPPDAQQFLEIPNLASAAELTLSAASPNPVTLVVHANDDASAEQLESLIQKGIQMQQAQLEAEAATGDAGDPVAQAWSAYSKRTSGDWAPQREGAKLTFFRTDGADARERQLVLAATLGYLAGKISAAMAMGGTEQPGGDFPGIPGEEGMLPPGAGRDGERPGEDRYRGEER